VDGRKTSGCGALQALGPLLHTAAAPGLAQSARTATVGAAFRPAASCEPVGDVVSIAPITSTQTLEQATNSMVRKMDSNFMARSPVEQKSLYCPWSKRRAKPKQLRTPLI
jgi:hypothetical protein